MVNIGDVARARMQPRQEFTLDDLLAVAVSGERFPWDQSAGLLDLGRYAPDPIGSFLAGLSKKKKQQEPHGRSPEIEQAWQDYRAGERANYGGFGGGMDMASGLGSFGGAAW